MIVGERKTAGADELAILALARGATYSEAAEAAGCSEATVRRRMGEADFKGRVRQTRSEMCGQISARLLASATAAVAALEELAGSGTPDPRVRLQAATALLDQVMKFRGMTNDDARLAPDEELDRLLQGLA